MKDSVVGSRLQFKHLKLNNAGFIAATDNVLYFFKFKPSAEESSSRCKGVYYCILKWRAPEFENTSITSIDVYENPDPKITKDSSLVISTKDNQILYLNLNK